MLEFLKSLASDLNTKFPGSYIYLTGGKVRDMLLMQAKSADWDLEVHGVSVSDFIEFLSQYGQLDVINAKSFGVIDFKNGLGKVQFTFPRRERKTGVHHTDFEIDIDEFMSVEEAQSRRNYTINSVYYNILTGVMIDNFNGIEDARRRVLRATSSRFSEDPLRVLIGVSLASRYRLKMEGNTVILCRNLKSEYYSISKERVYEEHAKWLSGDHIFYGWDILREVEFDSFFPQFGDASDFVPYPEYSDMPLDAYISMMFGRLEYLIGLRKENLSKEDRIALGYAVIFMDLGMLWTRKKKIGPKSYHIYRDHEGVSIDNFRHFAYDTKLPNIISNKTEELIRFHEWISFKKSISQIELNNLKSQLRYNSIRVLELLFSVNIKSKKDTLYNDYLNSLKVLCELDLDSDITPLIMGRHLKDLGLPASPKYNIILKDFYQRQLNGEFESLEEGLIILKESINDYL